MIVIYKLLSALRAKIKNRQLPVFVRRVIRAVIAAAIFVEGYIVLDQRAVGPVKFSGLAITTSSAFGHDSPHAKGRPAGRPLVRIMVGLRNCR